MLEHTEVSAFVYLLLNNSTGHVNNCNLGIQQDTLHRPDSTQRSVSLSIIKHLTPKVIDTQAWSKLMPCTLCMITAQAALMVWLAHCVTCVFAIAWER